jgi:hypothetical protein
VDVRKVIEDNSLKSILDDVTSLGHVMMSRGDA